ncbi:MAG: hypothetical protein AABX99_04100 [Nanoarchaeota archaeon]
MERKNLLEKALNRFERMDLKEIILVTKSYHEPDEYLIRVGKFKLVLAHQEHSNRGQQSPECYFLRFVYAHGDEKLEEFREVENFGRIKEIYDSIKKKADQSYKMRVELKQRESEKKLKELERKLRRLERKL